MNIDVVVTRHPGLIQYLKSKGLITDSTPVLSHATSEDVAGKHVLGVLPLHLAAKAASTTEVPLAMELQDRAGGEISFERMCQIAGEPVRYIVTIMAVGLASSVDLNNRNGYDL